VHDVEPANPLAITGLSPEGVRHHQLEKTTRLVFDSRLVHQPLFSIDAGVAHRSAQRVGGLFSSGARATLGQPSFARSSVGDIRDCACDPTAVF